MLCELHYGNGNVWPRVHGKVKEFANKFAIFRGKVLSICSDGLEGCKRPPAFYDHIASWFTYFFPFSSDFLLMLL